MREQGGDSLELDLQKLQHLHQGMVELAPDNWLLRIEVVELLEKHPLAKRGANWQQLHQKVRAELQLMGKRDSQTKYLIDLGLELISL